MLIAGLGLASGLFVRSYAVDITPPEPLPLGGYTARGSQLAQVVPGSLWASTIVFSDEDTTVALVSAEMLTIPESLVQAVQDRLPKGINLFLSATHTHNAPDSQMLNRQMTFQIPGLAKFNEKWLTWYADRLAFGIKVALARQPQAVSRLIAAPVWPPGCSLQTRLVSFKPAPTQPSTRRRK
jgi:neutral ceramidase